MIENTEVIAQDMLRPSAMAGKVRVAYPRGAETILSVDTNGMVYLGQPGDDGAYQWGVVLPNGNLLYLADRLDSKPTVILGAGLVAL